MKLITSKRDDEEFNLFELSHRRALRGMTFPRWMISPRHCLCELTFLHLAVSVLSVEYD